MRRLFPRLCWPCALPAALALLALAGASPVSGVAQAPAARAAAPDAAEQARAESAIRKIFKDEYARAEGDAAAARELAATLLQQARATTDSPALRFVALREARDLAARAGDLPAAYQAAADLARDFAVDPLLMKTDALTRAAQKAATPEVRRALAEAALGLLDEALAGDGPLEALRLAAFAEGQATRAKSLPLIARAQKRARALEAFRKEFEALRPAAEKLRTDPHDPGANLTMGRYYCLAKGNWARGLPLLALGADAGLKELARRDLAAPLKAAERAALGDGWWDQAEQAQEPDKSALRRRAAYWYQLAVGELAGAAKDRAAKRLGAVGVVGLVRTFSGHARAVQSAALSPDGRLAVSGGDDDDLRLWDVATGKTVRLLKGHTNQVWSVAFSPDGKYVLSGGDDNTVRLWDAADGKEIRRFAGHTDHVNRVGFAPDGRVALSASDDKTLRLWQVATGKEFRRFEGHQKGVWGAAFARDGKKVISGGLDKTVGVWDAETGKELRTLEGHTDGVMTVALLPDGRHALSGGNDKTLRLWDLGNAREVRRFEGHTGAVLSLALAPDGRRLLSCGQDKTIRLWDVATGRELHRFDGHTDEVVSVAFSGDGRFCLSASLDRTVRLWGLPK
jgi:WD40 repeat protein